MLVPATDLWRFNKFAGEANWRYLFAQYTGMGKTLSVTLPRPCEYAVLGHKLRSADQVDGFLVSSAN